MADEQRPGGSGPTPRLSKVIRGDSVAGEVPLGERPILPKPRGVVNAEEFEASVTARQIVERAEAKAAEIIANAEKEKETIFAKAAADAKAEVFSKSSEELARAKMQAGKILSESEQDVLELALRCAQKIIGRDLERDPTVVIEIVATATEAARQAKAMVLRVNPKDGALLREKRPKLMEQIGRTLELAIRDDADVEPGGCIIQTEFGTIDAQLKTQFDMLKNLFTPEQGRKDGPK